MRYLLLCVIVLASQAVARPQDKSEQRDPKRLDGLWIGTLKAGLAGLRFVVRITKKDAVLTGTLDSIDEGLNGIPIDPIDVKEGAVRMEFKTVKAVYEGKVQEGGADIFGKWKQRGAELPLNLRRTDKAPEIARPQNPKKPYPYDEHEVKFDSLQKGIKLAGTLTVPRGDGPFPAAIMLSGSGPQDRDEALFNHKPFLVIADHLTRRGIAVLRVDDRGVGGSTGKLFDATLDDNAQDVLACIGFLKGRKEIDSGKIGLIGHSEGGLLAPYVAVKTKDVAYVVMLAGTGLPGEEILYLQGQAILKAMGVGGAALKKQREVQELMFTVLKQESDNVKAKKLIYERLDELMKDASPIEKAVYAVQKKGLDGQLQTITTPWFRFFLTHDPRPTLRKVNVPLLALIGEKDVQVPPKENLEAIGKALAEGGNKDHTLKELPGLNHLFQSAKTGALTEYGKIEETFAPAALTIISDWIVKRTK